MAWSDNETRNYAYDGSNTAITETLDSGFKYTITVHGADGQGGDDYGGGTGGFVKATYVANSTTDVDLYVGGGNGSTWGRFNGGVEDSSNLGSGGGSTEVILSNAADYESGQLVTADAGGGGGDVYPYGSAPGAGGGRCGTGFSNAECPPDGQGFGGNGGFPGEDGGQEVISTRATSITETKGGSQHPDGTGNGYIEITASASTPISGTVVEGNTGIQGATVEAINQSDLEVFSGTTDSSGNFSVDVYPGTYHVVARYEDGEGKKRTFSKPYIDATF